MPSDDLLRPDNHDLFDQVRMRLVARNPVITWEQIAEEFGVSVAELVDWFLAYRMPAVPEALAPADVRSLPRNPQLRAELSRLRHREGSLVTIATEAPEQLARVQRRIVSLERAH